MTSPKATDPLTKAEMEDAAGQFFPLFNVVLSRMPEGATIEDTLKVMEHVATLAHRLRKQKKQEQAKERFGLVPNFKGSFQP